MKKTLPLFALAFLLSMALTSTSRAQGPVAINHIALYVFDLKKSTDFYKNVLKLQEIPEPFHDGKHVWFRIGPHSQLHVIQGAASVTEQDKNSHLAFSVKNLPAFLKHLDSQGVRYSSWQGQDKQTTPRPDGVQQVYLQDPDNYWLEVNNDKF
ncbi:VOC family protein [Hymenobacter fodinae]|nr:VOC family protein [Hymenobacter fodinae]